MRYSAEHKEETHDRIVRAASRRFRRNGTGVGIGQLMTALKLTHGGFYRHFRSKDQLLAEALEKAFEEGRTHMTAAIAGASPGQEVRAVIEGYLREENLADTEGGCPLAALAPEIARQSLEVRRAMDQAFLRNAAVLAPYMPGATDTERRGNVAALMSGMAGSLAMARAVSDENVGKRILEAARKLYIEAFCRR
jgi:TetR/AcrR family transcriptional regulator, transcriptional repressor for nem operon